MKKCHKSKGNTMSLEREGITKNGKEEQQENPLKGQGVPDPEMKDPFSPQKQKNLPALKEGHNINRLPIRETDKDQGKRNIFFFYENNDFH